MLFNIPCRSIPMPYYKYVDPKPDYSTMPFTIEAVDNTVQVELYSNKTLTLLSSADLGQTWSSYVKNNYITLQPGDKVSFSGPSSNIYSNSSSRGSFIQCSGNGKIKTYGQMKSLIGDNNTSSYSQKSYAFIGFFNGCTHLVDAQNLFLPNGIIGTTTCNQTFLGMFSNCTSLTAVPFLDMTTELRSWRNNIYSDIFANCTSLSTTPKYIYPAYIRDSGGGAAVEGWFTGCTNLRRSPIIRDIDVSTWTASDFYIWNLFHNNSYLSAIQVEFTSWDGNGTGKAKVNLNTSTLNQLSTSLFIKPQVLSISRGGYYIPEGWTVLNRIDGKLYYAETANGHTAGDEYTGVDPYAD